TNKVYRRGGAYQLQTPESITPLDLDSVSAETDDRAKKIADAVTELEEIDKASVVITGNTAIVGIQTKDSQNDSGLIKTKERVEAKVKSIDKDVDHVGVTAANDLVKRISRMSDAGNSKKYPGYSREVRDIADRLAPPSQSHKSEWEKNSAAETT
ncbi:MAG: YhcN/YlaJ family sporulation lipoprotein, partial [Clostridiales bacterium]|nr:YhcN/YlaJ family sporulation lipoprotein [Clostridiales bacterium]